MPKSWIPTFLFLIIIWDNGQWILDNILIWGGGGGECWLKNRKHSFAVHFHFLNIFNRFCSSLLTAFPPFPQNSTSWIMTRSIVQESLTAIDPRSSLNTSLLRTNPAASRTSLGNQKQDLGFWGGIWKIGTKGSNELCHSMGSRLDPIYIRLQFRCQATDKKAILKNSHHKSYNICSQVKSVQSTVCLC